MTSESEQVVAHVVLKPASGREITGESTIRADTLQEFAPDPGDATAVARALADASFQMGPTVGIGMSMTGPRSLFEQYFGVRVEAADRGGWVSVDASGEATRELPVDALPEPVARRVHAVTFEEPAELVSLP